MTSGFRTKPAPGVTGTILASDTSGAQTTAAAPFGHALVRAAEGNPRIVGLTADLGKYTDLHLFAERFPDRFFQVGMAEQDLIGISAGLARTGFIPFATTYGVFATRRAYDFIAIGAALGRANVKIVAGLPGLTTGYGGTHQAIEDLALMRMVPNLVVIDPCDATELAQAVPAIAEYPGPVYLRLLRGQVPVVLDPREYRFEIGKARKLRLGSDAAIISTGLMTGRALEAADRLSEAGTRVTVFHASTIKPLDRESILAVLRQTPNIVTAENHVVRGGLASAVADLAVDAGVQLRLSRIGIPDTFCESGSIPYLVRRYHMDVESIVEAVRAQLEGRQTDEDQRH
jgi:transketolase